MRKLARVMALVLLMVLIPSSANADPGPAVIIEGPFCFPLYEGELFLVDLHAVEVNSRNDTQINFWCHGEIPDHLPKPAKAFVETYESTGRLCFAPTGTTTHWIQIVTPSGKVTISCHFPDFNAP